jgi:hypothetical protein
VIGEWLRANYGSLLPFGIAGGVGTPTVIAITNDIQGPERLPWSLVAAFVILLLTGALVTLPQHKRELKQLTDINDRMFDQIEQLIENDSVIMKALEDIKAGPSRWGPPAPRRTGQDRR